MVGRRLDAGATLAMALEAALADVPMSLMAVLVNARARAPVWREEGDDPCRGTVSYNCVGGNMFRL